MAISTEPTKSKKARPQPKQRGRSHIDVYLVIRAPDLDVREISEMLGMKATRTWRRGDLVHPPAIHRYKDDGWVLRAKHSRGYELTKYVEALIDQVEPNADRFASLPPEASVYVQCAICDYEFRRTQLGLSKKALQGIARLGAELDIDYYDLSDHSG